MARTAQAGTIVSTRKTTEGKAFTSDVDTLQKIFAWEMTNIFHAKPTDVVFSVGTPSNGGKSIYCKYKADLQFKGDVSKTVVLATVSPYILGDVKEVVQAIAYVCLHSVLLQEDGKILARKKGKDFRQKAEKFGLIAEKSADVNAGYERVSLSPALWQAIQPALAGLDFNLEAIPIPQEKKTDKKTVYTYISPDRRDVVKSENAHLNIWAKMGAVYKKWDIATPAMLQERRQLLATEKAANPDPSARGKTLA